MAKPKLWNVTIEIEAIVMADSKQEAERFAKEIMADVDNVADFATAVPMYHMPNDLEYDSLIYHKDNADVTLEQALEKCDHNYPRPRVKAKADAQTGDEWETGKNAKFKL
jgi:hypothetical protein